MTGSLPSFCPYCKRIVPAGERCQCRPRPKRKPTPGDATRSEREPWRKAYSSSEYQAARQRAIERQRGLFMDCGRPCAWYDGKRWRTAGMGGEVDHEQPLRDGICNERLTLRCKSCHAKVENLRRRERREGGA